jgi:hypothetical protein
VAEQGVAIAGEATLQAGVQSALEGGSFLNNLKNAAVSDVAAAGAFDIGSSTDPLTFENVAEHAILGCAASAAEGSGCAGGAIGGAVSAGLNPIINSSGNLSPAALAAVETLVSGSVAGALGLNVQGAVTAAQNETLNNFCEHNSCGKWLTAVANNVSNALNAGADVPAMESAAGTDVLAGIGNTALNAATFSLPGMPDYVPYFQYSNPALGALGELYGTFGLGTLASSAFAESVATNTSVAAGASLVGADGNLATAATWVKPQAGVFDVVVHGDANGFSAQMADGSWVNISANQLSNYMSANGYAGEPVRLISCGTGACNATAAQNLANQLGAPVTAPSSTVWIHPNGNLTIGSSATANTGTWNTFVPGGAK